MMITLGLLMPLCNATNSLDSILDRLNALEEENMKLKNILGDRMDINTAESDHKYDFNLPSDQEVSILNYYNVVYYLDFRPI